MALNNGPVMDFCTTMRVIVRDDGCGEIVEAFKQDQKAYKPGFVVAILATDGHLPRAAAQLAFRCSKPDAVATTVVAYCGPPSAP